MTIEKSKRPWLRDDEQSQAHAKPQLIMKKMKLYTIHMYIYLFIQSMSPVFH